MGGSRGVPGVAHAVGALGEEDSEEEEEEPGDFKPEHAAGVSKWPPDGFAESFGSGSYGTTGSGAPGGIGGSLLLHGMRCLRGAIAEHSGGDPDADAQFASNATRLHTQKCSSRMLIRIASIVHRK